MFLRPFNAKSLFERNLGIIGIAIPDTSISILPILEQAVSTIAPIVVLSEVDTPIRGRQWSSLVINSTDANWRDLFHLLARSCEAMLIIPADSPGLIHEITTIISHRMIDRCVFYQPPVLYFIPNALAHMRTELHARVVTQMAANWENVAERFQRLGIVLPDFDNEGSVFSYNPDASLRTCMRVGSASGQTQIVAIHRDAFNNVLSHMPQAGTPLKDIIPKIEVIEDRE